MGGLPCVTSQEADSAAIWLPGGGSGRLGQDLNAILRKAGTLSVCSESMRSMETFRYRCRFGLLIPAVIAGVLLGFLVAHSNYAYHRCASGLYTPPRLKQTALASATTDSLVIEAFVDSRGRVWDYRVISSAQGSKALTPDMKNLLIFSTFRPATFRGSPTAGTAVLSFSKIGKF